MNPVTFRRVALALSFFALTSGGRVCAQDSSSSLPATADASLPASAAPTTQAPSTAIRSRVETTFALGVDAQLTAERVSTRQSFDPSAGVTGEVRQSFRPWLGYSINLGYTRTTGHSGLQNFSPTAFNGVGTIAIPANMYETSFAYLAQTHVTPKITAFFDVGGGAITLLPVHRGATAVNFAPGQSSFLVPSVTFRPLAVGGFGFDYHITPRLALRAEYRGLFYKFPDYGRGLGKAVTVSSQPTLSLTYTLGGKKK